MAGLIESITSPLNAAGELVKHIVEVRDTIKLGELQVDLQSKIMAALQGATAAQTHELEMGDTIRELKDRVMQLENWEAEKKRYVLTALPPGVHVYALKPEEADGEIPHQICQACYQRRQKSILNRSEGHRGVYHLKCPAKECGVDLRVGHSEPMNLSALGRSMA